MVTKNWDEEEFEFGAKDPHYITRQELTADEWDRLTRSNVFCMMPWVHLHAFPDGRAYPCCMYDYWEPAGDLRKNTMREVWNQEPFRILRQNILKDTPVTGCSKCYEIEKHGGVSARNTANRNYGHLIKEVNQTSSDGTHPEFKIRYWDIRFSNLCNFRCRTCGPVFSSNWYNDHVKLYGHPPGALGRVTESVEYAAGTTEDIEKQMDEHIPYLEEVYFAGGEPLIMKEHYALLDKLIALGKTDVRLQYNTNFSELQYKDKHIFDYWKQFVEVGVGASLDGMGPQAELLRKGTNWMQIVKNREQMIQEVPHVYFYVNCTVSTMNVLHALDFHKEFVSMGLIRPDQWNVNICQSPEWYRCDIFPLWFKKQVIYPAYEKHIEWLTPRDPLTRAATGYRSLLSLMQSSDASAKWPDFLKEIETLDNLRNENFWTTFPELAPLKYG